MISAGLIFAGLVLLLVGAETMIRGAVAIARRLNISPHVIGLTVIAFGTSAPELFVSLKAAMNGSPGIAIGNVIGSNIANILLMIGTVGVISPFVCGGAPLRRDGLALILGTILFVGVGLHGIIERWHGAVMLALLVAYLLYCYYEERRRPDSVHAKEVEEFDALPTSTLRSVLYTVGGLIAVLVGARLLVDGAVDVANRAGISETVIGITVVAVGTSLPELATTLVAALRRHSDVALGNIIGSNIFNTLGILGTVALVSPLPIPPEVMSLDLWFMLGVTIVFVAMAIKLPAFSRPWALVFFAAYVAFIANQFVPMHTINFASY
ncbi:calcium/sodium antiporter [Thalassobaculum sp. OXR-137]|uniref:calcium/sodium antiporter n=1 Tax=Thalassobaculum sp. OXR-137 TaxID=3100173 RepID=UPI002AC98CA1|nr:calcium/sodium antiporter [Thalassobaculum sp. OXR-137]WPZ36674.1 calcium/sodium antiporter [Thalassobaculum sp. OXR-137]